ncbi:MAG: fucose isomerase, partial [Chloroflexi bacterium]
MATNIQLAFVPIARTTFDIPLAREMAEQVNARLAQTGFTITGPDSLVTTPDQARAAADHLTANPPDLLLLLQATFADSTMVMELARQVTAPLLLWAVPEAHTGGRLRLNSLCGINLAGHALTRANYNYDTIYAPPNDEAALEKIMAMARAGQVKRRLQQARLGRVGQHPDGFETCAFDAAALNQTLGLKVV